MKSVRRFPGFIDVHVHLRDPGATHKEDFVSGTRSALAGGFTFVLDMPNNPEPTITLERLEEKISLAQTKAVCPVGFHYGTDGANLDTFTSVTSRPEVFGLKVYLNHTTGSLLVENEHKLDQIFAAWRSVKPILVHAETDRLALALGLAKTYRSRLHVCHVARASEVTLIRQARLNKLPVSAGVTPHHLYLTPEPKNPYRHMKPLLGDRSDQAALWEAVIDGTIDLVETDHAPHTTEEKLSPTPPFGVPGLETAAQLLYEAVINHKITEERFVELLHMNPKRIFSIPDQPNTYVEMAIGETVKIGEHGYQTKANWSPFDDWPVASRISRVVLNGRQVI